MAVVLDKSTAKGQRTEVITVIVKVTKKCFHKPSKLENFEAFTPYPNDYLEDYLCWHTL